MKKNKIKIAMLIALVMFLGVSFTHGQIFKPVVSDIGSSLKPQKFVLVIKASENLKKPERVVMDDWSASEEPFDPDKLDSYPKWSFQNFTVIQKDGSQVRHLIIKNETTGKYFSYPRSKGPTMRTQKEFDDYFAKNEQNRYKKSLKEQYEFLFIPKVDGNYIRLGIPNDEGKNLAVTPGAWQHIRDFKLVLVK